MENGLEETFLIADIAAAVGAFTVANIDGYAIDQLLWMNPYGERSEIVITHSARASGSTVTLAANTVFAHYAGEKVYRIEFNQVEISHAATLAGIKSVLATSALQADQIEFPYLDTSQTTGFYSPASRTRSQAPSAPTLTGQSTGDGIRTRSATWIRRAGAPRTFSRDLSNNLSVQDCFAWINDGLDLLKGKLRRWPEHMVLTRLLGRPRAASMPSPCPQMRMTRKPAARSSHFG